eukprot:NODE_155_length_16773_cov_0.488785.p13 type:complete len:111 gc:universal NODE_155_length_16773_cov_0.488785:11179-10847(-)
MILYFMIFQVLHSITFLYFRLNILALYFVRDKVNDLLIERHTLIEDDLNWTDYLFVSNALVPTTLFERKKRDPSRVLLYIREEFHVFMVVDKLKIFNRSSLSGERALPSN